MFRRSHRMSASLSTSGCSQWPVGLSRRPCSLIAPKLLRWPFQCPWRLLSRWRSCSFVCSLITPRTSHGNYSDTLFMTVVIYSIYDDCHVKCQAKWRRRQMRVSRDQVLENKRTILAAAGRLFRERGFESVTVAEIMKSAGLTHGGFYGYFNSKDDLIAQAMADVFESNAGLPTELMAFVDRYLSPPHRDNF